MALPRRKTPELWGDRRGMAAVEMAVVTPFLMLVMMACIDFGRAISQQIQLATALRAGAQYAVMAANAQTRIEETIRSALPSNMSTATIITACYCGALPSTNSGLPPTAACDSACPAGSARMMTLRATFPFRPYTLALSGQTARALGIDQVAANVTTRQQ